MRFAIDKKEFGEAYHIALAMYKNQDINVDLVYDKDQKDMAQQEEFFGKLFGKERIRTVSRSTYDELDNQELYLSLKKSYIYLEGLRNNKNQIRTFFFKQLSEEDRQIIESYVKIKQCKPDILFWIRNNQCYQTCRNTTVKSVKQIHKIAKSNRWEIAFIGDYLEGIEGLISRKEGDLINYYNDKQFRSNTYLRQLYFYDQLQPKRKTYISIGMMSGAMDGPAFIGIPTIWFGRNSVFDDEVKRIERLGNLIGPKIEIGYNAGKFMQFTPGQCKDLTKQIITFFSEASN
jgi:hypothetical protein